MNNGGVMWLRVVKTAFAFVLLAFGLYGAFVAGQMHPAAVQKAEAARPNNIFRPSDYTYDGRFSTRCTLCFVPFVRLIVFPERYHGREIRTYGFLKEFYGTPTLFPSEESTKTGGYYENVAVNAKIPDELRQRLKAGVWVDVRGKFDATFEGQQAGLGLLLNAHVYADNVEIRPRVPDPLPKVKLETIKPVAADVPQFEIEPDANAK